MECNVKFIRESTTYKSTGKIRYVQVYCPILGDVVLTGDKADQFMQQLLKSKEFKNENRDKP